jgi:menaquinone-dependent protoporphyrinogen oxidase
MQNSNRILIAYATRAGSTAGIAARVGTMLTSLGQPVDVLPAAQVKEIDGYHNIVLGSAIRYGKLLPEAMEFIHRHQAVLKHRTFNTFIVCMTVNWTDVESQRIVQGYLDPVRAYLKPAHEGLFAGVVDLQKLSWRERILLRFLKIPRGDFRDWEAIDEWASGLVLP